MENKTFDGALLLEAPAEELIDGAWLLEPTAEELIDEVLNYLVYKGWRVVAHDTHRWIDSDGWYELQFELMSPDYNEDVYLHTYSTYERDFEEQWSKEGDTEVEICDIYWDDRDDGWDYKYALEGIKRNARSWSDLTEDLREKINTLFKHTHWME